MTENTRGLWSEPCYVYWHDTDQGGLMSLPAIARYLQEAAWHSAEDLGFGYSNAKKRGQFWVLVRQHIQVRRFPAWSEKLVVETWPRDVDGLWAFRDYRLLDDQGELVCGVTSSWMIIDINTHRPQKPEIVFDALPYRLNERAVPADAPKISWDGGWNKVDERKVRFSDLDHNGHVNNSKYIEWALDALWGHSGKTGYSDLVVNYIAEARDGQHIAIELGRDAGTVFVRGVNEKGKGVFVIRLTG